MHLKWPAVATAKKRCVDCGRLGVVVWRALPRGSGTLPRGGRLRCLCVRANILKSRQPNHINHINLRRTPVYSPTACVRARAIRVHFPYGPPIRHMRIPIARVICTSRMGRLFDICVSP